VREAANVAKCKNNAKQLTLALHDYQDAYNALPPSNFYQVVNAATGTAAEGSAFYAALPFYEQANLFNQYTQNIPSPGYKGVAQVPLSVHVCPSDPTTNGGIAIMQPFYATGNYSLNLALWGANGTYNKKGVSPPYTIATIPDGSSNTIAMVEASGCFPGYPAIDPTTGLPNSFQRPARRLEARVFLV
jgi:Protein of unknown function (DUF1559)